ncbi:MAG: formylglycine-generating enzyme family protein [Wenzhouxiangellaceae bacterium]
MLRIHHIIRLGCLAFAATTQAQVELPSFQDALASGGYGPQMVELSGGEFSMGDQQGNGPADEHPVRDVTLAPFAISRHEITFELYDVFTAAVSKRPADDAGFGRGERPAINVSWEDAQAFVVWLSKESGHSYRLPSEAQWEYAARGGATSPYFWGRDPLRACLFANVADRRAAAEHPRWNSLDCEDGYVGPAPVAQFPANAFGLHDVTGNVWEWVADCYSDNYEALPEDGRPLENTYCRKRVSRGGAWSSPAWLLRSSQRQALPATQRSRTQGFRVIRLLDADRHDVGD